MNIIYNPFFEKHQYINLENNAVLMDTQILSTQGLIDFLELRLGLHHPSTTALQREVRYYTLLKQYIDEHVDCILAQSFHLAELSVTKCCLAWRDDLVLYGWDHTSPAPTERLQILQAIEEEFAEGDVNLASRLTAITAELIANSHILNGITIQLMIPRKWLPPYIQSLLEHISGAQIIEPQSVSIDPNKVEIWHFKTDTQAYQYLATMKETFDLWINRDNKSLDNWMHTAGKKATGSVVNSASDPLQMLLLLTARMMARPLQLKSLIDYLLLPIHPINSKLRRNIADTAAEKGGYYNQECSQILDDYIVKLSEDEGITKEKIQAEREKLERLLPDQSPAKDVKIPVARIKATYQTLSAWAIRYANAERSKENVDEQLIGQLLTLDQQIQQLMMLVDNYAHDNCTIEELEQWVDGVIIKTSIEQYPAMAGCQEVIYSPADMVNPAKRVLWIHPALEDAQALSLEWLTAVERQACEESLHLWDKEAELQARNCCLLNPLRATEKTTFVIFDTYQGAETNASSLLQKIQAIAAEKSVKVSSIQKDLSALKATITPITNKIDTDYIQLSATDKIIMREKESASSLENMINHPLDYLMNYVVHIRPKSTTQPADVKKITGTTAHAILEELLNDYAVSHTKISDEKYAEVFDRKVLAYGAQLLQEENQLALRQLRQRLRECVNHLIDILEKNNLNVVSCEAEKNQKLGFWDDEDDIDICGYVDCQLKDNEGNPVVFDFKWTSSKKYYQSLLQENRSIQLAIYRALINEESSRKVQRLAYFLMPEGRLYSTSSFEGEYCHKIDPVSTEDLLEKVKNSYTYRRKEIESGKIETTEATTTCEFDYVNDTENNNLVPLKIDIKKDGKGKGKELNRFTDYAFLLTKK